MNTDKLIIKKQEEIIHNLSIQLLTPEPTTYGTNEKFKILLSEEERLRSELASLLKEVLTAYENPTKSKEIG